MNKKNQKYKMNMKNKRYSENNIPFNEFENEFESDAPKKWYHEIPSDPKKFEPVSEQILIELKEEAKKCHDSESANYRIKNSKTNSHYKTLNTVMSKGTVSDKIAAYIVTIQDNPIYNLETLRKLVGLVKAAKKKECVEAMETLSELFVDDLLKPKSPLKSFHERPLSKLNDMSSGNAVTRRKLLSAWYFEDQLKETYTSFVLALSNVAHDTIDHNKEKSIGAMFRLLMGNSEQEKNLLAYIVNKLGDPSTKVTSKAIYCLRQFLLKRPNKKTVVLNEIERILFRPNVSWRTQYYGLCFLTQFCLNHNDDDKIIARRLITVYFVFFKVVVKKGEVDSRMMSSLLIGVKRAYPYADLEMDKISEHIDTIYRIVHVSSFNVSIHALSLLFQVSDHSNNISDRFYSALYKKISDPQLICSTNQALVLKLIQEALMKDKELSRVKVFIKRLLQIALQSLPNFACAILIMVSQIVQKKAGLKALVLQEDPMSKFGEDEEEKYFDVKDEDESESTTNADNNRDQAQSTTEQQADKQDVEDDKPEVEDTNPDVEDTKPDVELLNATMLTNPINKTFKTLLKYNPLARNPLHAGGNYCAYTELLYLKEHVHPSVELYAKTLLEGKVITYSGDPLKDFTISRFLDRFAFKNPKKLDNAQGVHPAFGKRKAYQPRGIKSLPVNSRGYFNEDQKNIPVSDLFLHTYIQKKYADREIKEEDDGSDNDSVKSEEFEEMLAGMGRMNADEELDYMNDVKSIPSKVKTGKRAKSDDDEDIDDDEISDEDEDMDEIEDFEGDEDMDELEGSGADIDDLDTEAFDDMDGLDDEDDESIEFGNSDEEDEDFSDDEKDVKQNRRKQQKHLKKKKADGANSVYASADEFATLLEDEGSSKVAPGSGNVFANKDKAAMKQLDWEEKRNRWLRGFDKGTGKRKRSQGNGGNQFGKGKFNKNKSGPKNKKRKSK